MLSITAAIGGALMMAQAAATDASCARAAEIVPQLTCVTAQYGFAAAADEARARALAAMGDAGAKRFEQRFGHRPSAYLIVEPPNEPLDRSTVKALKSIGFPTVLPWLSVAAYRAQFEVGVRASLQEQLKDLPKDAQEAAVNDALSKIKVLDPAERALIDAAAVPHELGHDWYIQAYWPATAPEGDVHYAGPGPDWMDEAAAIAMEPDPARAKRLAHFGERYAKIAATGDFQGRPAKELLDLAAFFSMRHPADASVQQLAETDAKDADSNAGVDILTGEEAQRIAARSYQFYLQAAAVTEYLIERSGNPAILGEFGRAFGRGTPIDTVLAAMPGPLAKSVADMQADWERWLASRYRAQASSSTSQ